MGLADKVIAAGIRGLVGIGREAEKKAAGYVGAKVLNWRASADAGKYTAKAFVSKFLPKTKALMDPKAVHNTYPVPRGYMLPNDLKFLPGKDGERVLLGGTDITEHWNSPNFRPEHFSEYLPGGATKVERGPWWKGDIGSFLEPPGRRIPDLRMRYHAMKNDSSVPYLVRGSDYGPEEIRMGREWIAGTVASGTAFWKAVSDMRRPAQQKPQEEPDDGEE